MSAPKHTRLRTTWLSPREAPDPPALFKRQVLGYAGVTAAFQKLTAEGLNEDLLWRHLWGLAWLENKSKQKSVLWYSLPGLPLHSLRRFPDKVRSWADDIERKETILRSNQAYSGVIQYLPLFLAEALPNAQYEVEVGGKVLRGAGRAKRTVPVALAERILQRHAELPKLAELPELLRFYADYIEAVSRITAHYSPRGAALLHRNMPQTLVMLVEACTGRPHLDEIATLLTASYQAIGCDLRVDPKALAMQRSRTHSKK